MKRIRMKVEIAAPRPKRFWPLNDALPHDERERRRVVLARARRDREHEVEDLQYADDLRDEDDRQHGREQRDRDPPEDLPLAAAVGARGLEHVARDGGQAGADDHHREAGGRPRCRRT